MINAERCAAAARMSFGSSCRAALAVLALSVMVAAGCALRPPPPAPAGQSTVRDTREMLSTLLTLTVVADTEGRGREAVEAGFARIAELDKELSAYRADSSLAAVNAGAARSPVAVPADLYRIMEAGVAWHPKTRGVFDITVGPLIDLWKTCGKDGHLPTPEDFARVKPLLGANRIVLDPAARTVRFPVEGMRVDLGGLGKGFVADEVVKTLRARGARGALVSMSGDIYALGRRADRKPWRIGVQDPRNPRASGAYVTVLDLSDRAVSTSGNYERYTEIQGKRYSHIVDPRTGWTADAVASVTVIGPDTLTTDILDTSLSVLGVQEGLKVVLGLPGVEAMFVEVDANGEPHITRSPGFARYEAVGAPPDGHVK